MPYAIIVQLNGMTNNTLYKKKLMTFDEVNSKK